MKLPKLPSSSRWQFAQTHDWPARKDASAPPCSDKHSKLGAWQWVPCIKLGDWAKQQIVMIHLFPSPMQITARNLCPILIQGR